MIDFNLLRAHLYGGCGIKIPQHQSVWARRIVSPSFLGRHGREPAPFWRQLAARSDWHGFKFNTPACRVRDCTACGGIGSIDGLGAGLDPLA